MNSRSKLRAFISSRMEELSNERNLIESTLGELNIQAWKFETNAGARPETIQETYLGELQASDFYIGIFWKGYGIYTINEYEKAREIGLPCFIYEKRTELEKRDSRLQIFLDELSSVTSGVTIQWFNTEDELNTYVKRDISAWLASLSRKGWNAGQEEKRHRSRKLIRNRIIAVTGIFLIVAMSFFYLFAKFNAQRCKQDQEISQRGEVHVFEAHYDDGKIRWWLQQPVNGFLSLVPSSEPEFPLSKKDAKFILTAKYDQSRDYIWVGTSGRGLVRLARKDGVWKLDKRFDLTYGLSTCNIQTILIDNQRIYLGPIDSRIPALTFSDDGETWQQTPSITIDGDDNNRVLHTFYDLVSDGKNVWAGTSRGLYRFDGIDWFGPFEPDWLKSSLSVHAIAIGWGEVIWAATEGNGILLYKNSNGTENWSDPLSDFGIENIYSMDLFSSGKQALISTPQGLFTCSLETTEPLDAECEVINSPDINQKTIFSLQIAPDDSQVLLGTDDELIPLSPADWER